MVKYTGHEKMARHTGHGKMTRYTQYRKMIRGKDGKIQYMERWQYILVFLSYFHGQYMLPSCLMQPILILFVFLCTTTLCQGLWLFSCLFQIWGQFFIVLFVRWGKRAHPNLDTAQMVARIYLSHRSGLTYTGLCISLGHCPVSLKWRWPGQDCQGSFKNMPW